jgi:hypothetical protein
MHHIINFGTPISSNALKKNSEYAKKNLPLINRKGHKKLKKNPVYLNISGKSVQIRCFIS